MLAIKIKLILYYLDSDYLTMLKAQLPQNSYFKALSSKLKQSEVVNPGFVEVKPSAEQDLGAILQVSLPNGVRIGVSCSKTNILIEQVLLFVGQLP